MIQSVISENSQEMKYDGESDTYEKVQIDHSTKVSESVDKLLEDNETAKQGRKIFIIGEKRVTGKFHLQVLENENSSNFTKPSTY